MDQADIDWTLERLNQCEQHSHVIMDQPFCPTRLIDVREGSLRLALREEVLKSLPGTDHPQYTALSYVWGPPTEARLQLKTDSNNLLERRAGINEDDLTAAVRDAVRVTRALSIPYLWVDALCILQDMSENKDWERECTVMDKIYGNAKLTICAATSRSCNDGFLSRQTWMPALRIPFQSLSKSPTPYDTYRLQSFVVDSRKLYLPASIEECNTWESQWCKRGWTFQERVLSTRCLTFGWLGLMFSCPTSQQIQNGVCRPDPSSFRFGKYIDSTALDKDAITRRSEIYRAWAVGVIPDYSLRRSGSGLSRITDCLPALAGLAAKFSHILGVPESEYVAGLWQQDLFRSLIWTVEQENQTEPPSFSHLLKQLTHKPSIAPSWSWASWAMAHSRLSLSDYWPGKVEVLGYTLQRLVSFRPECKIAASTAPHGDSHFGEISGGFLRVTTKMRALPSHPLTRKQMLVDADELVSGHKTVYPNYRYIAMCMFDWSDDWIGLATRWRNAGIPREPYNFVTMILLGSAELAIQCPEHPPVKMEDKALETRDNETGSNAGKSTVTSTEDGGEGVKKSSQDGTKDSNSELDWDADTEIPEDSCYKEGDRCAYGLLVIPTRGQRGKYHRVGVFFSEPRGCGDYNLSKV
ncbi:hypothetical protein MFIFM68171_05809 [Madurella fahalii]|uniref:Heterokaryon incompatibility domain-containing protein n=1 Tax=Madurella fahalii TaxID=1157608 RepID=A0ABQ0GD27_9PEZI